MCDAHDGFTEVAAFKHADEGRRSVLEAVGDILAIANASIGNSGRDCPQEFRKMFFSKFRADESPKDEPFG